MQIKKIIIWTLATLIILIGLSYIYINSDPRINGIQSLYVKNSKNLTCSEFDKLQDKKTVAEDICSGTCENPLSKYNKFKSYSCDMGFPWVMCECGKS